MAFYNCVSNISIQNLEYLVIQSAFIYVLSLNMISTVSASESTVSASEYPLATENSSVPSYHAFLNW